MSGNDNFSLHDDEELSLHDDASLDGSVPASNKGYAPAKPPQNNHHNTLSKTLNCLMGKLKEAESPKVRMGYTVYLPSNHTGRDSLLMTKKGNENINANGFPKDHLSWRENEQLSKYGDTKSARAIMLVELKKLIEANPLFRDKLQFPNLKNSRLRTLINQSLNWQHQLCKNPRPNPDIKTLFVDHSCGQPNGARAPSPANNPMNPLLGPLPKAGGFPPMGAHGPFQPAPGPIPTPLAGWMSNPPQVSHPSVSGSAIGLGGPSMPAALKHPSTPPTNPTLDFPSADSDHLSKRTRNMGMGEEVNLPINVLPVSFPGHGSHSQAFNAPDDLPKTVARTLNQGSSPMSMDFHPIQQTLLLGKFSESQMDLVTVDIVK
ncbi:protein TOPLESS [Tanacetum coccineum]